jgi:glycine/D-amino acid oxidase-like deaminating enzyme
VLRMSDRPGQQAIVVGGSIAGLTAARVLSDYFEQVLVLERDEVADRPVIHKSVPQGNHLHALLHGGLQVLSLLYPAFTEDLRQRGSGATLSGIYPTARRILPVR